MSGLYYHPENDDDFSHEEIIILMAVLSLWWGIIHLIDWLTFDMVPWWLEPFTILLLLPYGIVYVKFGSNPLHWWPLVWGTRIKKNEHNLFTVWNDEETLLKYGGPANVYFTEDYIKFRKRRDAFEYCLTKHSIK